MIRVTIKDNEPIEKALKRFKKKMEKSGTIRSFRSRQYFTKNSVKRRNALSKAIYRQQFAESQEA